MANFINGGAVNLFHAGVNRFKTTSTGAVVTGILTATSMEPSKINLGDNERISVGLSSDLSIYHDGNHSRIVDSGTGHLFIHGSNTQFLNAAGSETIAKFTENGPCELRHNNDIKFATTNAGAKVTGDLEITGVLTYEDVTNVDSIGVITARSGVLVGSGITLSPDGDIFAVGVSTFSGGATFGGNATFADNGYLTTTSGITIENSQPGLLFSDTSANPDFIIQNRDGSFAIRDTTNAANRLSLIHI